MCLELRKKSAQRYIFIGTSILLVVEAMDIDEKPEGKGEKMKTRRSTIQFWETSTYNGQVQGKKRKKKKDLIRREVVAEVEKNNSSSAESRNQVVRGFQPEGKS